VFGEFVRGVSPKGGFGRIAISNVVILKVEAI